MRPEPGTVCFSSLLRWPVKAAQEKSRLTWKSSAVFGDRQLILDGCHPTLGLAGCCWRGRGGAWAELQEGAGRAGQHRSGEGAAEAGHGG